MKPEHATSTAVRAIRKSLGAVLRHIFDDAEDARYRAMQRDIESWIGQSGGHFSDETERRIARRLMRNSSF
jgi:lysophospholipase L1-like esterase